MSKGARTREQVVEQAAALFNQLGYQAASIADVMEATGLKKGGIYRHFASKEALGLEAFEFAVGKMKQRFVAALADKHSAADRLRAIFSVYVRIPIDPPVPGGCPVLNASVEADDAHPLLRERAQLVMNQLKRTLRDILRDGITNGEFRNDLDVEQSVHITIALLEGSVMMAKLYGNQRPMRHLSDHLESWLHQIAAD